MADSQEAPAPIIVRRRKNAEHAHHGGTWKVAYADFVTAMMAFFLLLWLLNASSQEQRLAISHYFDPMGATRAQGGSMGVMGGHSPTQEGSQTATNVPPSVGVPLTRQPLSKVGAEDKDGEPQPSETEPEEKQKQKQKQLDAAALDAALAARETAEFDKAENMLRQAVQDMPELKELGEHLLVDQTPEGLRIQLVDQERRSMFARGSAQLLDHARGLLALVAQAVKDLPNKLTVSGHTDSTPYPGGAGYTNWELSSDRANASRKVLMASGIGAERIVSVAGKADREHLEAGDPNSPRNRRIGIVLLREAPVQGIQRPPPPGTKAEAPPRRSTAVPPREVTQRSILGTMGKTAPPVIEPPPKQ